MPQNKDKLSITLDIEVIKRVRELAANDDRSASQYINRILRDHIRKVDAENGNK